MRGTPILAAGVAGVLAAVAARKLGLQLSLPGTAEPRAAMLSPGVKAWLDELAREVNPVRIRADVERLPSPRSRLHAPEAIDRAEEMILQAFHEAGWAAERQSFSPLKVQGPIDPRLTPGEGELAAHPEVEGTNVVAVRPGVESDDAFVVLAHYDTVRDSPGANDNGASVAALLELARILAGRRFRHTIVLAATDMEELGLFGARALASRLLAEHRVIGVVNYETMGSTSSEPGTQVLPAGLGLLFPDQVARVRSNEFRGDFTCVVYNGAAARLAATFASSLARLVGPGKALLLRDPKDIPAIGRALAKAVPAVWHFSRGDHLPFWDAGAAGLFATDTANFRYRHYHTAEDTPEKLDYDRLAAIVGATAATIAEMARLLDGAQQGLPESSSGTTIADRPGDAPPRG